MSYYEFKLPAKILSGEGALEHVPHELQTLGASRPLLLSDQGLAQVGTFDRNEKSIFYYFTAVDRNT